jgi:23S rRNA pseudouridine1911/1915/1917 synthase
MVTRFGISGEAGSHSRLDLMLTQPPFALSRREAKRRLSAGDVVVDGQPVSVASREIRSGAHVTLLAPGADVPFLYVDSSLVVVDKPDALPTQPSPGSSNPSLLEVVASKLKKAGSPSDLHVVHRLDTNTTGAVALARTKRAADEIARIVVSTAEKRYFAICEGRVERRTTIDSPIARLSGNHFGVATAGRSAVTHVDPCSVGSEFSLLEVRIETGRTHQIRVHLASIGHPVAGDRRYGSLTTREVTRRPMLHARVLALPGVGTFEGPLPDDFRDACTRFGLALP